MKRLLNLHRFLVLVAILFATMARADDLIPKAAWRRPLGLALENPGTSRVHDDIDDGYWQGAPAGGFGSGTFSRSYRGDFVRWHMKAGVLKYETVYANPIGFAPRRLGMQVAISAPPCICVRPQSGQCKWPTPTRTEFEVP